MTFQRLLDARSVAIVGASPVAQKGAGKIVTFLRDSGYEGRIYPVNPRYETIGDWRCYASVDDLPETVDVMVVIVPVAAAFEAMEAAARRGVPFAILSSGSFGEGRSGAEGEERLARLQALSRSTGMKVLGPNTIGMVNFRRRMPLTYADWYGRDTGARGGVAVLTNSGSVGGLIFSSLQANAVGVDFWVATGNEAVIEVADVIEELADDPELHTIACFLEGVMNGRRFMAAAAKARRAGKRVVVLKAGSTPLSSRSSYAHTLKRSSDGAVYDAVLSTLGVVQTGSQSLLAQTVKLLGVLRSKPCRSVGIISASGGACTLIADHVSQAGLDLPLLSPALQAELEEVIPPYGSALNPVDVSADVITKREMLLKTFEAVAKDDSVDVWIIFGRPIVDRFHADIVDFVARTGKSVVVCTGVPTDPAIEKALADGGATVIHDPSLCVQALGAIHRASLSEALPAAVWESCPPRAAADGPVDAAAIGLRHGLAVDAAADAGAAPFSIELSVRQDGDFGPLLAAQWFCGAEPWQAPAIRPMPVADSVLAALLAEAGIAAASPFAGTVSETASRLARLYLDEAGVAAFAVRLAVDAQTARVVALSAIAAKAEAR